MNRYLRLISIFYSNVLKKYLDSNIIYMIVIKHYLDDRKDINNMALFSSIKEWSKKRTEKKEKVVDNSNRVTVDIMESKFENDDLVGAAKDLKLLLEIYGIRKKKNHRYKGRTFIYFILSNKHKEHKNVGYKHWQNLTQIIQLNHKKVYPYHKKNLRNAMDFFKKEIRGISQIDVNWG